MSRRNPVKKIRKRITYANVMSSLAVFLVLGGATAFAATKIGSNEIKANAILTGKIKKEAVTTSKLKNDAVTGAKAKESTFGQVPSAAAANTANFAASAENATPRLYAKVISNSNGGGVDETVSSKNISDASVTFVAGSVYCFEVGFAVKNVQASVDWIEGGAGAAQPDLGKYSSCPEGSDFSVRTTKNDGGGVGTATFFISVIG
jgi:hypothetical protein